jgi:hypothetical protein
MRGRDTAAFVMQEGDQPNVHYSELVVVGYEGRSVVCEFFVKSTQWCAVPGCLVLLAYTIDDAQMMIYDHYY